MMHSPHLRLKARATGLVGVGDLVDQGPHSAEAVDWNERRLTVATPGNHDVAAFSWLTDKLGGSDEEPDGWLRSISPEDYARWIDAFRKMPLALHHLSALFGSGEHESPHRCWPKALELLESGHGLDIALRGFPDEEATQHHGHTGPVEGVRALLHGHRPVAEVERTGNRWNIDTGAGIPELNRLSILELGPQLRPWTFDVDEARTCRTAQVDEEERQAPETARS